MDTIQQVKQRFGIIGNHPGLNHALEKTLRVAATEISVLVTGESGVGKENIPKIIHQYSARKHAKYIAVNSVPFQKARSTVNYLVMKKELSRERHQHEVVILR